MGYVMEKNEEALRLEYQAKLRNYSIRNELKHLTLSDNLKVLDAGCGTGVLSRELLTINSSVVIDACDFSELRIAQAKKINSTTVHKSQINFFSANLETLEISNHYDLVISRYVFEHLRDAKLAAKNLYNACKEGGAIYLIDFDGIFLNLYTSNEKFNKQMQKLAHSLNFDLNIGRKLPSILKNAGFRDVEWNVEVNSFKDAELVEEIDNCVQRCENAAPLIYDVFGHEEGREFINDYIDALSKPESVLFYNKFIVSAIN